MLPTRLAEEVGCDTEIPRLLSGSSMHRPSCSELSIILRWYAVQIKPLAITLAVYFGKENLST